MEDPFYPLCGTEVESITHAVWLCGVAKAVWFECSSHIQKYINGDADFLTLFSNLSSRPVIDDLEFLDLIAQQIWFRRNRYVFLRSVYSPPPPSCLIKGAKEALAEYREVHASAFLDTQQRPPLSVQPVDQAASRFLKIELGCFLDKNQRLMWVGIVARDSEGNEIAAKCSSQRYISNPSMAEAYGARICAEFGQFMGLRIAILEGDALEVANALNRVDEDVGKFGNLIGGTRRLLNAKEF